MARHHTCIEDLSPFFEDRCWLFILLAREANVGVILRRGPSQWWRVTLWDTKRDHFGKWPASESRSIGETSAKLITGNAGGLSVEFNGKSIGAVSGRGQVRVVTFSPDRFEFAQSQTAPSAAGALGDSKF
ncbi:MAG TPA: RodZ domain-containing protein [Bryobacteraceae bacterium]|nr:RodZ domain-containing protein [Bryobacteraceae bacterium]